MPPLIAFVLSRLAIGSAIGIAIMGAILFSVPGLADLVLGSDSPALVLAMLAVSSASIFGPAYLTTALLLMAE